MVSPYMRVCPGRIGVVREADWELSPGRVEGGFKGGFKGVYPRQGEFFGGVFRLRRRRFQVLLFYTAKIRKKVETSKL